MSTPRPNREPHGAEWDEMMNLVLGVAIILLMGVGVIGLLVF